ncbi:MAG: MazG family protein [Deltaproteobacteria bacterium]|nr:MazG family protein [Deltaproteobacteria bacterium]
MDAKAGRWERLARIWWIIDRLRGESGCPWDRKQTPESVQTYLVEEAHEAAAAVRGGRPLEAAEELGDLLFMVFFLVHLYEEDGKFDLERVCQIISEKMIRRHPHVFGDVHVNSSQEVRDNWEKIKAEEKAASGKPAASVPESLPALMRAYRVLSRLSHRDDFDRNDLKCEARRFASKSGKLARRFAQGGELPEELWGQVLLDLVNLARLKGIRAEDVLHAQVSSMENHFFALAGSSNGNGGSPEKAP